MKERKIYVQVGFRRIYQKPEAPVVQRVSIGVGHTVTVNIEKEEDQPLGANSQNTLCFKDCKASYLSIEPVGEEIIYCISTDAATDDQGVCDAFFSALKQEGHPVTGYRQVFPMTESERGTGPGLPVPGERRVEETAQAGAV